MKSKTVSIILFITLILLGACVSVVPKSTHVEPTNYLLTPVDSNLSSPDSDFLNGMSFYVRQVELAPYLEASGLTSRVESNKVEFSNLHRWGEPLDEGIARVVAKNLSIVLGTLNYSAYPHRKKPQCDLEIGLHLERFEKVSGAKVTLVGTWQLFRKNQQVDTESLAETIKFPSSVTDLDKTSQVSALSLTLGKISEHIAVRLVRRLKAE
jgi:uncharacterized lipoprotein YmbA